MQPPVRFLTTADGVSIAYSTQGEGSPLVFVRGWISHIEQHWDDPEFRAYFEPFIRQFRLVRYDMRGNGLSDQKVATVDLEGAVADLEAIMGEIAGPAILFGQCFGGPIAIAYAARHPERVSRLILDGTYARGCDVVTPKQRDSLIAMLCDEPDAAHLALSFMTEPEPEKAVTLQEHYRSIRRGSRRVLAETLVQLFTFGFTLDVSACLKAIEAPTLVLHRREIRTIPFRVGRELASQIPNASFVALPGSGGNPWNGDVRPGLSAIGEFLGVDLVAALAPRTSDTTRAPVLTILFTDIVGHTEMMRRLGDAKGREVLREHERITREALKQHGGAEVKTDGDSFMASFASVTGAVECALALQRAFAQYSATAAEPIVVRMGLHAGEPIAEGGDLFGSSVILASRIHAQASGGEILVSDVVRSLLSGKNFLFSDRGEYAMKGFDDPLRLYEVRWREAS